MLKSKHATNVMVVSSDSVVLRRKICEYKPVTRNYIYQTQDLITPLQLLSIIMLLSVFFTIKALHIVCPTQASMFQPDKIILFGYALAECKSLLAVCKTLQATLSLFVTKEYNCIQIL
jgi:hypothetical protein